MRILELDKKKSWLSRALRWAHPREGRRHTDNADRWLCVSLSNKAQFSVHLEVKEFWSLRRWIIFAQYFGPQHKPSTGGIKKNKKWIQMQDEFERWVTHAIFEYTVNRKWWATEKRNVTYWVHHVDLYYGVLMFSFFLFSVTLPVVRISLLFWC